MLGDARAKRDRKQEGRRPDITYIRTWQGWLYLAVVMDLTRRYSHLGGVSPERFEAAQKPR